MPPHATLYSDIQFHIVISSAVRTSANADVPAESRNLLFRLRRPNSRFLDFARNDTHMRLSPILQNSMDWLNHGDLIAQASCEKALGDHGVDSAHDVHHLRHPEADGDTA